MAYATAAELRAALDPEDIAGLTDAELGRLAQRASEDIDLKLTRLPDLADVDGDKAVLRRACVAHVEWKLTTGAVAELASVPSQVRIGHVQFGDDASSGATAAGWVPLAPRAWEELRRGGLVSAKVRAY